MIILVIHSEHVVSGGPKWCSSYVCAPSARRSPRGLIEDIDDIRALKMRLSPLLGRLLAGAMLTVIPKVSGSFEDTVPALMLCTHDVTPCLRAQRLHASLQGPTLALAMPDNIVAHTVKDKSICDLDSVLVAKVKGVSQLWSCC